MLIDKDDAIKAVCEACYMYKYISEHYKECKYYPCDDIKALEAIPSAEAEQVTGKLKKPCDSLLTGDSAECKESGSKLDYISRADAIEELKGAFYFNSEDCRTAIGCIKALPSAEAVQGWIPCSERLPRVGENVLFTTDIYGGYVAEGDRRADGKWWQYRWNALLQNDEVTAWMPLPTPYKGGEDE